MAVRALYSVVQYIPDPGRGESANVGVVLYVPAQRWLEVRISPSLKRVRRFFAPGRQELQRLQRALEGLEHRIDLARDEFDSEDSLARFAAARADVVSLTPPRVMTVVEPQAELELLYSDLVGEEASDDASGQPATPLPPAVARVFGKLEAEQRVLRPGQIRLPTTGRPFAVAVAYDNGRRNYVRPESLVRGKRLDDRMAKLGFSGRLIYKHPIDAHEGQLIVLSADAAAEPEIEERFERILADFDVRFIPSRMTEEFAAEVERTAH